MDESSQCRGSIMLGTACMKCRKCKTELKDLLLKAGEVKVDNTSKINLGSCNYCPNCGYNIKKVEV